MSGWRITGRDAVNEAAEHVSRRLNPQAWEIVDRMSPATREEYAEALRAEARRALSVGVIQREREARGATRNLLCLMSDGHIGVGLWASHPCGGLYERERWVYGPRGRVGYDMTGAAALRRGDGR